MKSFSTSPFTTAALIILAGTAMVLMPFDAFAQAAGETAGGFGKVQQNISTNIVEIPKFITVVAYVIAAFFAATGLVKLKDWINDNEKNPINPALFRLVVASLLIVFPHMLVIVNSTLFGSKGGQTATVTTADAVKAPSLNAFPK